MAIKSQSSERATAKQPQEKKTRRPNIKDNPKRNTNGLDKNPQNINKNGPVKKNIAEIIKIFKSEGYEKVSKTDIEDIYKFMIGLSEVTIDAIIEDTGNPILVRSVALYLKRGWQDGLTVVEYVAKQAMGPMQGDQPTQFNNNFLIGSAVLKFQQLISGTHDQTSHDGE